MTSVLILKFFGIYFSVLGLACFLHPKRMSDTIEEIISSKAMTFIAGFIPLVMGAVLVIGHPVQIAGGGIPMVVSILSIIILVVGGYRLLCPNHWVSTVRKIKSKLTEPVMGIIIAMVGFLMLYVSYVA